MEVSFSKATQTPKFMPQCRNNASTFQKRDVFWNPHANTVSKLPMFGIHETHINFFKLVIEAEGVMVNLMQWFDSRGITENIWFFHGVLTWSAAWIIAAKTPALLL